MERIGWIVMVFLSVVIVGLSYAASFHGTLEGYFGGNITIDCEYEVMNIRGWDYDSHFTCTQSYHNFSPLPSTVINGVLHQEEDESNGLARIYGRMTFAVNDSPYNVEIDIKYDEEEGIEDFKPDNSFLKINGVNIPLSEELIDLVVHDLLYLFLE